MTKNQQILLLFCVCPFKNVKKSLHKKYIIYIYILNNKKKISHVYYHTIVQYICHVKYKVGTINTTMIYNISKIFFQISLLHLTRAWSCIMQTFFTDMLKFCDITFNISFWAFRILWILFRCKSSAASVIKSFEMVTYAASILDC